GTAGREASLVPQAPESCALTDELQAQRIQKSTRRSGSSGTGVDRQKGPTHLCRVQVHRHEEDGVAASLPVGDVKGVVADLALEEPRVLRELGRHTLPEPGLLLVRRWSREAHDT